MSKRTGRLNQLLRVEKNTGTSQATDGYTAPSWSEKAQMWCHVGPKPGTDLIQDSAEQWQQPIIIIMRYDTRVIDVLSNPTKWRLRNKANTVVYDVQTAVNAGLSNEWLELTCLVGSVVPAS